MKTIYLKGDIGWEITAEGIKKQIDMKSSEKLRVFVNSSGGWVFEAYEIYDLFKLYKGEVEFVIMPYAASAMSYVVMAGNKITIFKNSLWMAHKVWGIIIGDSDDLIREAGIMQGLENIIIEAYQTRLPFTKEEMKAKLKNEVWAIGWEQLTEMGLADEIIDSYDDIEIPDEIKEDMTASIEEAAKSNIDQIVSMRIKKIESRIRDEKFDYKTAYERIAAKVNIDDYIKQESNTDKTVDDKNLNTEDNKMPKLDELLQSNPDAQAEYTANLQAAEQRGRDEAMKENDVGKERLRIFNILKFSGFNPAGEAAKAINEGTDSAQFAQDELMRERDKRKDNKNEVDFGELKDGTMPGDQDRKGKDEVQGNKDEEMKAFDKKLDEAVDKKHGKKEVN